MPKTSRLGGADYSRDKESSGPVHKITYQGQYLKWQFPQYRTYGKPTHKRGNVTHFSDDSRFRVFCLMNKIDWSRLGKCVFITLGYPDFLRPNDKDEMNRQRARFARDLENRLEKGVAILWRIEWQDRKSGPMVHYVYPHIHLLCFDVPYIHYAMVNRWWRNIIGYKTDEHLHTDTRRAYSKKSCLSYVSKYCGKIGSLGIGPYLNTTFDGRQWGCLRRELVPMCDVHYEEAHSSFRLWHAYDAACPEARNNVFNNRSFTRFGDIAEEVGKFLFGMQLDGELLDV